MFESLKRKFSEWLEDTTHWWKTGESTIRCCNDGEWHKVYLDNSGASRMDILEVLMSKGCQNQLKACHRIAINNKAHP